MKKALAFISCEYFLRRDRCFGVDRERAGGAGDAKPAGYGEREEGEEGGDRGGGLGGSGGKMREKDEIKSAGISKMERTRAIRCPTMK